MLLVMKMMAMMVMLITQMKTMKVLPMVMMATRKTWTMYSWNYDGHSSRSDDDKETQKPPHPRLLLRRKMHPVLGSFRQGTKRKSDARMTSASIMQLKLSSSLQRTYNIYIYMCVGCTKTYMYVCIYIIYTYFVVPFVSVFN